MGESTSTDLVKSGKKQKKAQKHKLQQETETTPEIELPSEVEQPLTKLRKPQTPVKKSHKKIKKEQRLEAEKTKILYKYKATAVSYLQLWKSDKSNWKFSKNVQNWIVAHLYDAKLIPDSLWPITLEYFMNSKGVVKTNIMEQATRIIEDADTKQDDNNDIINIQLNRAKDIIQSVDD